MSSSVPSFHLITSIRYDSLLLSSAKNSRNEMNFISPSPFYMLVYHRDRLMEAAQHFGFAPVVKKLADGKALHESLLHAVEKWKGDHGRDDALKVRVLFDKSGGMNVECAVTPAVPIASLYPASLDPPKPPSPPHPAQEFEPSPLTGGLLTLGSGESLPGGKDTPPTWKLRIDKAATPSSPFTLLKTTHRDLYNKARSRTLPVNPVAPSCVEVIMYNKCAEVTEGSITSLYFYRGGRWVTPPVGVPAGHFTAETLKGTGEDDRWDEGELRKPFAGRWGHSVRSAKVGAGGQRGTTRRWALAKGMCMEEPVSVDTVQVGEGVWVSNAVTGFGYGTVVE